MPQESLRSVVYRSFVTCEDPRGVVEGKTIKISKIEPAKMSNRRNEKETRTKSSKEVQKLNEAIGLWSKGASFKHQQKNIAKDLLKGALDLQESLMLLGKLQEASRMTSFKKKEDKPSKELFCSNDSDRFKSFQNYDLGHQKERKLANGSSRDCFTELREVIQQGLSKQNLLPPNKSYQESNFSSTYMEEELAGKRKLQLSPDISSTSSSTSSSMIYSTQEFTSWDSFSSRATDEKSKGSNLIAKLMGLEAFPSKPPLKQLDIRSKTRPVFDVDLQNARKPQFFVQKSDQEHASLDDIIQIMQSRGLLRSNKQDIKQTSKRFEDDAPPIVLMRLQRVKDSKMMHQKVKAYENPIRKLHQDKTNTTDKSVKNRGTLNAKLNSRPDKQKASVPVVTKSQRKQEVEKKIEKTQNIAPPCKKKSVENANTSNSISKNRPLKPQRSALANQVSNRTCSSALSTKKSDNQKKNTKIEKPVIIHGVLQIDSPNQEETEGSEVTVEELDYAREKPPSEAFEKDSYLVTDVDSATGTEESDARNNQEENGVCDIDQQKTRILKTISLYQDPVLENFGLLQDCINEFLELENQRQSPLIPISILPSRVCISEDQMTREILKKVQSLNNYSTLSNKSGPSNTVSVLLERDLNLSYIGGAWGTIGWKDGCTIDEVQETVLDLERMVLSRLIDDVLIELFT